MSSFLKSRHNALWMVGINWDKTPLTIIICTYWPHNKGIHGFSPSVQFLRMVSVVAFEDEIGHHTHRLSQHHEQSLTQDMRQQTKWWPEPDLDVVMLEVGPLSILVTWRHRYLQPKSRSFSFIFSPILLLLRGRDGVQGPSDHHDNDDYHDGFFHFYSKNLFRLQS